MLEGIAIGLGTASVGLLVVTLFLLRNVYTLVRKETRGGQDSKEDKAQTQ